MNGKIIVPLYTDGCEGTVNHVKYLEHVQARITMTSSRRGEIQINLTSPSLTRSILLAKRTRDTSREGFNNWAFMTTHNWGEPAKGQWTLEIENGASSCEYMPPSIPLSAMPSATPCVCVRACVICFLFVFTSTVQHSLVHASRVVIVSSCSLLLFLYFLYFSLPFKQIICCSEV